MEMKGLGKRFVLVIVVFLCFDEVDARPPPWAMPGKQPGNFISHIVKNTSLICEL